jgi:hypothetical protein
MLAFLLSGMVTCIIHAIEIAVFFTGSIFTVLFVIFGASYISELGQKRPAPIQVPVEEDAEDPQPL